jgi:hypothetical protein
LRDADWEFLSVFRSKVRVKILQLLLALEFRSLSEISKELKDLGWNMTLSGVLKHVKELEKAGLLRHESGVFVEKPDARKTIYFLEGRERVEKILQRLENGVLDPLLAGVLFIKTAKLAREMQGRGKGPASKDRTQLESLLLKCEAGNISIHLTEDEKKKLRLWKMMLEII